MSEHTPGPWIAERVYGGTWQVVTAEGKTPGNYLMATTNNEANARLIAKAPLLPEMAAALRELLDWSSSEYQSNPKIDARAKAVLDRWDAP